MGQQFGVASVYGVFGVLSYTAYVIPESLNNTSNASIDEFKSGINQLLGFYKTDERMIVDLVLTPKADTLAHARAALDFPVGPLKITLSGMEGLQGAAPGGIRDLNGDYVYKEGAERMFSKGASSFRLQVFRPLDVPAPYLGGGRTVPIAADITTYIDALVTPIT